MFTIEFKIKNKWTGMDIHPYFDPEPANDFARLIMRMHPEYQDFRVVEIK